MWLQGLAVKGSLCWSNSAPVGVRGRFLMRVRGQKGKLWTSKNPPPLNVWYFMSKWGRHLYFQGGEVIRVKQTYSKEICKVTYRVDLLVKKKKILHSVLPIMDIELGCYDKVMEWDESAEDPTCSCFHCHNFKDSFKRTWFLLICLENHIFKHTFKFFF